MAKALQSSSRAEYFKSKSMTPMSLFRHASTRQVLPEKQNCDVREFFKTLLNGILNYICTFKVIKYIAFFRAYLNTILKALIRWNGAFFLLLGMHSENDQLLLEWVYPHTNYGLIMLSHNFTFLCNLNVKNHEMVE